MLIFLLYYLSQKMQVNNKRIEVIQNSLRFKLIRNNPVFLNLLIFINTSFKLLVK